MRVSRSINGLENESAHWQKGNEDPNRFIVYVCPAVKHQGNSLREHHCQQKPLHLVDGLCIYSVEPSLAQRGGTCKHRIVTKCGAKAMLLVNILLATSVAVTWWLIEWMEEADVSCEPW